MCSEPFWEILGDRVLNHHQQTTSGENEAAECLLHRFAFVFAAIATTSIATKRFALPSYMLLM